MYEMGEKRLICTAWPNTRVRIRRTISPSVNPFDYQSPVGASRLIDRRAELDALQLAASNRTAIRLAAPRRFGKTTLLDAHVAAMREVGHRAVRVDFSKVATVADAAARVASAYGVLPPDPGRRVARWAARLGINAKLGPVGVQGRPSARRPDVENPRAALLELLDVPAGLAEADGDLTVVCFDEFQDLLVADDALDGLLRSVIQHHGEAAAYVFAGSQPSLMRALFSDQERPFYGQARPLELPPLPIAEAAEDIAGLLEADGLLERAGGAVDELVAFTGGHPQRTMLLAHQLYDLLDAGDGLDDPALDAIERALEETRDAHQALWDALPRSERIVCIALADGQAPTGSRVPEEHRVARSTLQDSLERLLADGRQVKRDAGGAPYLLDPLFAEWLRRR
jgi:uncharacterized protein